MNVVLTDKSINLLSKKETKDITLYVKSSSG